MQFRFAIKEATKGSVDKRCTIPIGRRPTPASHGGSPPASPTAWALCLLDGALGQAFGIVAPSAKSRYMAPGFNRETMQRSQSRHPCAC